MAISVTTTPNTSDTASSLTVNYSGVQFGGGQKVVMDLRINGTSVQSKTVTPTSSSGSVTFNPSLVKSSIWANAYGKSLSGAVVVRGTNTTSSDAVLSSANSSSGTLTINTRLSNLTNQGANINLDTGSYIKGSWTNPNTTYFRGYFVATMSGGTVGSAGGQNTYYDYSVNPGTGWWNNANTFIGSNSSATITYNLYTQFYTSAGWSTQGGSVGSYSGTVTKTQYYKAIVNSFNNFTVEPNATISYSATPGGGGGGLTYSMEVRIDGNRILGTSQSSSIAGTYTLTSSDADAFYSALAGQPSKTAQLAIATYINGTWFGESTANATISNVIVNIQSFLNTERAGTSLSYSWSVDTAVSLVDYKIGSGEWVNILSGLSMTSGTFQITGLSPNTSYSVYLRVQHPTSLQYTTSSALTISTVNTSIISNQPDFNIAYGATISVTISKVVSNMLHTIYLKSANEATTYQTISNVDVSGVMTLTNATIDAFYALTPNASTLGLMLVCESVLNGVSQGTTKRAITGTVTNASPSVGGATYLDINPTIQAILGNNQKILQGKSTLKITATNMTSQKSATLSSLVVSVGQQGYSVAISGTSIASQEITLPAINEDTLTNVIVRVIDSRGIASNSYELPIQYIPYRQPNFVEYEIERVNNYYADAYFKATYEINSVITNNQKNTVYVSYRFKLKSSEVWGDWVNVTNPTPTISGDKLRFDVNVYAGGTFDMNSVYNVEARISDTFTTTPVVFSSYIPMGMGHLEFYEDYVNFGVQPYFTDIESLEHPLIHTANLGLVLQVVYPIGSIYLSTSSTNPNTLFGFGTWVAYAEGRTLIGVGTSDQVFSAGATGGESEHVLTSSELPSPNTTTTAVTSTTAVAIDAYTEDAQPHNNLPPYIVTYIWQRTA